MRHLLGEQNNNLPDPIYFNTTSEEEYIRSLKTNYKQEHLPDGFCILLKSFCYALNMWTINKTVWTNYQWKNINKIIYVQVFYKQQQFLPSAWSCLSFLEKSGWKLFNWLFIFSKGKCSRQLVVCDCLILTSITFQIYLFSSKQLQTLFD